MKRIAPLLVLACVALTGAAPAGQMGAEVEIAPGAEKTRSQTWASAAWCEAAKCWLVVWREGFLNEEKGEIWCARVSAEGKALDPAGVRLSSQKGLKDRPRVASDGKGFLVVWEDLRGGKDWDVYAARVSGEGKVQEKEGFLVAGGAHNQCRPDVVFAGGNYFVAWMGFTDGYDVYGARVSPAGKALDPNGLTIADLGKGLSGTQAITPVLASNGGKVVVAATAASWHYAGGTMILISVDPATGKAVKLPTSANVSNERVRTPAIALGRDEAFMVTAGGRGRGGGGWRFLLHRLDSSGASAGKPMDLYKRAGCNFMLPRLTMVRAGRDYLFACEYGVLSGDRRKGSRMRTEIHGWHIAPDGGVLPDTEKGFVLAADAKHDLVLPSLAAGPKTSCLAVYSCVRGADDIKVLARIVKGG